MAAAGYAAGEPDGAAARVEWVLRPIRKTINAGPFMWVHQYTRCPYCYKKDGEGEWIIKESRGSDAFKTVECCDCNEKPWEDVPSHCVDSVTRDEVMIGSDMAMVADFEVDDFGVVTGCQGLPAEWTRENIVGQAFHGERHGLSFYSTAPHCRENSLRDGSAKTMAQWVEHYSEDQNAWADDFYDAWERMLSTGTPELKDGPDVLGIDRTECGSTTGRGRTMKCTIKQP